MTVVKIESEVRRLVQDAEQPYHWSSSQLKDNLKMAVKALHKVRPETRYVDGLLVDCVMIPDLDTDPISIDERFEDALVYYTAYLAYSDDCTDPVSKQLADDFLAKFNAFAQM